MPDYQELARPEIDVTNELERVANIFGVRRQDFLCKRRNFPARLAGYYHLVEQCGRSLTAAGYEMGVKTSSVSMGIKFFKEMTGKNKS